MAAAPAGKPFSAGRPGGRAKKGRSGRVGQAEGAGLRAAGREKAEQPFDGRTPFSEKKLE